MTDTDTGTGTGTGTGASPLLPIAGAAQTRRALRALLRPHRGLALLTVATLTTGTAVGLVMPAVLGRIVDLVTDQRPSSDLTPLIVVLLAAGALHALLHVAGDVLVARLGESVLARLRERVVDRALGRPLGDLERAGSGDLVSRVSGDVGVIAEAIRTVLPTIAASGLLALLTLGGMAALDWRFALAGLCAAPVQAYVLRWYLGRSGPIYAAERVAEGARTQQVLSTVAGAPTVRAFALEDDHVARIAARSEAAMGFSMRAVHIRSRFLTRLNIAEMVGLSSVLVVGFLLVRDGQASVGDTTAAALYFERLFSPVMGMLALFDTAQAAGAGMARLVGIAELDPVVEPDDPPRPASGTLEARDVHFAYDAGHEVLHGVDLTALDGQRVALVGSSGAGKTTLAKLLAGIHEPDAGRVAIGDVPLSALGPVQTRRVVALVTQEVHVFSGRLEQDLRLAAPDADDDALWAALERVGAAGWARGLPDGLATVVGDGGHRLTPTQAQQLALARLVLADPPVAILDEATAEAGSAGARTLEAAAEQALAGRTALVVAHRLTQAATADVVVVMEHGRVVEAGPHDVLVQGEGPYARLWAAWSVGRDTAPAVRPG